MNKNICNFLFFIFLFISGSSSQANANDTFSETAKVHLIDSLNQLCTHLWFVDPKKAISYGEEALLLANHINDENQISNSLRTLGGAYLYKGEHHAALNHLYKSLKLARSNDYKSGIKSSLNSLGILYFRMGDYQNALFYHTESMKISKETKDHEATANSLNHIGEVYQKLKDYDTARKYYTQSLVILEKSENEILLVETLNNIGSLYRDQTDYVKAVEYYYKSIEVSQKNDNFKGLSDAFLGLGLVQELQDNLKEAELNFKESLKLSLKVSDKINVSENYYHLARQAFKRKNYELASAENYKSYELALAMGAKDKLMDIYGLYAQIYARWKDYEGAYSYLGKANVLKETLFHESLSKSLANIQMAEEEAKYQKMLYLKDLEIKESKAMATMLTIILILTGAVCVLIYKGYYHKKKIGIDLNEKNIQITKQNQEIEDQRKILEVKNTELQEAQELITEQNIKLSRMNVQLDQSVQAKTIELVETNAELEKALNELDTFIYKTSHDIRGPLARLMGLCNVALLDIEDDKSLRYFTMMSATANYLNSTLVRLLTVINIKNSECNVECVDLNGIIQQILKENSTHEGFGKIKIDIDLDKDLKFQSDPALVKLVLNNLIENSIKYYNNQPGIHPFISIIIHREEDAIKINIIDNGVGIKNKEAGLFEMFSRVCSKSGNAGLGLYMAKVCVEKLKGNIKLVENPSHFTEFSLTIPVPKEVASRKKKLHKA